MPAGHVHPLPPPSHGHPGPLGPPRSTTKYVISPRGCSPSSWLPSPHWLLTLPQDIKSCSPSPAQYVRQQEPLLHGCARWTACFHPTALTKMHGQFPSLCVPPGDPLCRCSRAPLPPHRWAPALCQPCPRMETRGQWALPLPSRGSGLVGGTVRCFTHKNSTQHLLTPPWCARHCRYSLTFSC